MVQVHVNGTDDSAAAASAAAASIARPGLRPFSRVLERLGIEAEQVLFGHTHRTGPLQHEDSGHRE